MTRQYKGSYNLSIGAALYFWRTLDGLSQREIAERAHMKRQNYYRIENSRVDPRLPSFTRLAKALNVSPYMLALTMEALS